MPNCGCRVDVPEADHTHYACPCGSHCTERSCVRYAREKGSPMSYRQTFLYPSFLNDKGAPMPDTTGWQKRHRDALIAPQGFERPIVEAIKAWALYADAHATRYESGIGADYALGPAWRDMGRAIHALLDGETGRLDCGTLSAFVHNTLRAEGFADE